MRLIIYNITCKFENNRIDKTQTAFKNMFNSDRRRYRAHIALITE